MRIAQIVASHALRPETTYGSDLGFFGGSKSDYEEFVVSMFHLRPVRVTPPCSAIKWNGPASRIASSVVPIYSSGFKSFFVLETPQNWLEK
jgi:hypothetical protein